MGGYGIAQDYETAHRHLQAVLQIDRVSDITKAQAQYFLGKIYFLGGYGIAQDYETAHRHLQAVLQINRVRDIMRANAQYFLGQIYFQGLGVEQNYETGTQTFASYTPNRRSR